MLISSQTRVTGLIGGPAQVRRSVSPAMHNAAFQEVGLDWVYLAFGVEPGRARDAIKGLAASGVAGVNVTMPHKTEAVDAVDHLAPEAEGSGAVNTLVMRQGVVEGHNTDPEGFRRYVESDLGVGLGGLNAVILGTGGAARAVAWAMAQAGVSSIEVAGRSAVRASWVSQIAGDRATFSELPLDPASLSRADLVINATPVGQSGEPPLFDPDLCSKDAVLIDLIYGREETGLVARAKQAGLRAHSGLGMLVHQAALSFELWTGRQAPIGVMSAAAVGASAAHP